MIHFSNIPKFYTQKPNNNQSFKGMISIKQGDYTDSFDKSFICLAEVCDDEKSVCPDNFPSDYIYKTANEEYLLKPHYVIETLESYKKGAGKNAIKQVLKKSLANPKTEGRIILYSASLDKITPSAGFYYKLGFRFNYEENNKILNEWMNSGGKKETSPYVTGPMYLPKENIIHCLNY